MMTARNSANFETFVLCSAMLLVAQRNSKKIAGDAED